MHRRSNPLKPGTSNNSINIPLAERTPQGDMLKLEHIVPKVLEALCEDMGVATTWRAVITPSSQGEAEYSFFPSSVFSAYLSVYLIKYEFREWEAPPGEEEIKIAARYKQWADSPEGRDSGLCYRVPQVRWGGWNTLRENEKPDTESRALWVGGLNGRDCCQIVAGDYVRLYVDTSGFPGVKGPDIQGRANYPNEPERLKLRGRERDKKNEEYAAALKHALERALGPLVRNDT